MFQCTGSTQRRSARLLHCIQTTQRRRDDLPRCSGTGLLCSQTSVRCKLTTQQCKATLLQCSLTLQRCQTASRQYRVTTQRREVNLPRRIAKTQQCRSAYRVVPLHRRKHPEPCCVSGAPASVRRSPGVCFQLQCSKVKGQCSNVTVPCCVVWRRGARLARRGSGQPCSVPGITRAAEPPAPAPPAPGPADTGGQRRRAGFPARSRGRAPRRSRRLPCARWRTAPSPGGW